MRFSRLHTAARFTEQPTIGTASTSLVGRSQFCRVRTEYKSAPRRGENIAGNAADGPDARPVDRAGVAALY